VADAVEDMIRTWAVHLRYDTEGRADYRRKLAAGKSPMEATRCLKCRLPMWSVSR